jgi:hypothetical protein
MRKTFLIIPIFFLLLTSCNFPLFKSSETTSMVATRVAQTLAAANLTGTETPAMNGTVIVITATPNPLVSVTPTITPTATPADPKTTLGTPVYADSFSSGSAFGLKTPYSDDAVIMSVENGSLIMTTTKTYSGIRWRLTYPTPKNYYVEGTFKTVTCSGDDFYGLVMRAPDYTDGHGYYFGVTCGGEYYFMRDISGSDVTLVDWTADSHILTGNNQVNRIGVMLKDNHFSLYINGILVKELDDDGINAPGYFGVFISSYEQSNMRVEVEEINQWNLP